MEMHPLSGFGSLILGESLIAVGNTDLKVLN